MESSGSATSFQVYCPRCSVTFPLGKKRCVHCGSRLTRQRAVQGMALGHEAEMAIPEAEPETPSRGLSPLTLMWIVLLLGGYLYRACTSGA